MYKIKLKEWKNFGKDAISDREKINYLMNYVKELLFRVAQLEEKIDTLDK